MIAPYYPPTSDYAVEARIQYLRGNDFAVVARGDGNNNGYKCGISYNGTNVFITTTPYLGYSSLASQDISPIVVMTTPHTSRIEVKANSITCFIDGKQVIQTFDNTRQDAGQVGVYSERSQIDISSFSVIAI